MLLREISKKRGRSAPFHRLAVNNKVSTLRLETLVYASERGEVTA
jgi:hypothetical protein